MYNAAILTCGRIPVWHIIVAYQYLAKITFRKKFQYNLRIGRSGTQMIEFAILTN